MTNFSGYTNGKSFVFLEMADGTMYANIFTCMINVSVVKLAGYVPGYTYYLVYL